MSRQSTPGKSRAAAHHQHPQRHQRERRQPEGHASTHRWVFRLLPVLIALVTVVPFLPTLDNQFVNWDDERNFLDNYQYRGLGWTHLRWMWTTSHIGHYAPLTWMTLGLDYLVWGLKPVGYHLGNLLLHAANAAVFYLVARRILGLALPGPGERGNVGLAAAAAFAALLFALHPLRVESVAWATERRDVLSGLFYLSAILVYLRACEREERGRGQYWAAVGLFVCALLSKSMAVSLPAVMLILDVYPLRRLGGARGWWGEPARRVYLEKIPFMLLALAASAIAFLAQVQLHNMAPPDQLPTLGRLAVSAYGLSFYLWKTVAPVSLPPLYELPSTVNPWAPPFLLSYGLVLAITVLVLAVRRRVPGLPAAWLAYMIILLPVLGIFQNGPQIAADRYTYLAALGWALLASAGLLDAWRRRSFLVTGLAVLLLLGLGILTWNQVRVWHDSEKLSRHAVAIDPRSSFGQFGLGLALARQGKLVEAVEHYQTALRLKPDYAEAHNNAGSVLFRQGKLAEAIDHFQQALRINPDHAEAHNNAGSALVQQGKLAEAIPHYEQALTIKPDYVDAHNNVGLALVRQGKLAEAIAHYEQALRIKPDHSAAHTNWGDALAQQGKPAEAIEHYQQALHVKPENALAHNNWGVALLHQGRLDEAIEHFRQALIISPDFADAHTNWGFALTQQGHQAEANAHYQEALHLRTGPSNTASKP